MQRRSFVAALSSAVVTLGTGCITGGEDTPTPQQSTPVDRSTATPPPGYGRRTPNTPTPTETPTPEPTRTPIGVQTTTVTTGGTQFDPRNIRVPEGATVTWTNNSGAAHSIRAASGNWEGPGILDPNSEVTHTFEASGVYGAYCRYHGNIDFSGMSMKIAVGDARIRVPAERAADREEGGGGGGGRRGGGPPPGY
jgi:plastocyanin